jgi:hypothetical protein
VEVAHKILLLNFSEKESHAVAKAGFNVERGYIGKINEGLKLCPFYAPHPVYEYDILFYNSTVPPNLTKDFPNTVNLLTEKGSLKALVSLDIPPAVRVSFIGEPTGADYLLQGGAPFLSLREADANVSSLIDDRPETFSIPKLHQVLTGLKSRIGKVGQFYSPPKDTYPLHHPAALRTRNGDRVAGYVTSYGSDTNLHCIVLPQLTDVQRGVIDILHCLEEVRPDLFPDKIKRDWLGGEEFLLPEEKKINRALREKVIETEKFIEAKKQEKSVLAKDFAFVKSLLIATEDSRIPLEERLSGAVKKAFELVGFKVIDIDQHIKSAIKKEDFWLIDGEFLAITEVTGTAHKNPKIKEFNDILGRVATIYKRKGELVLPAASTVSGLLVLNYDIDNHPSKRPRVYTGEDEHIVETAMEQNIGLLSTAELHKVAMAVLEGKITKDEARAILRKPGRVEYDTTQHSGI